ncbi:MAG: hypothetical protein K6A68_11165, partial [Clostridiales bacterium]|nr:hypothetical protein [Clostridiales bacterium]
MGVDDEGIQSGKAVGVSVLGLFTLAEDGHDGGGVDGAILVHGHFELGYAGGDRQSIEQETRLIFQGQAGNEIGCTGSGIQPPV